MNAHLPVVIAVLAYNEERRIGRCLASLPLGEAGFDVHVVVNGSHDQTATIARSFAEVTVHEYTQGGKSRSWNRFMLDTPGVAGRHYVFVDGDAQVQGGSIAALVAALDASGANAASAFPGNGRRVEAYRETMRREHGLFGDLYALSGDFVHRLRQSDIRLPEDLIGDDGLIGALAKTDLGHLDDWKNDRVVTVEGAAFLCDPITMSPADLTLQARRMRNYSVRHFQNLIITSILSGEGPGGLPKRTADLYPLYLPGFRPRRDPMAWWFDRQALKLMRRELG